MFTVETGFILEGLGLWKIFKRYIIRASFSQERMNYVREESRVIYKSKDGVSTRQFDAVDFIASLCSHIPNMGEQMVRYLGFYSNVCRGRRKRQNSDGEDLLLQMTSTQRAAINPGQGL